MLPNRSSRGGACRCRLLRMLPFGKLLDDLLAERRQIVRLATGDESIIRMNFNVDPYAASVADIRLQARPGGERFAPDHIGFDEHPRTMTDCAYRFPGVEEGVNESDGILVRAQMVRVGDTTRKNQRGEIGDGGLVNGLIDREGVGLIHTVHALDGSRL